MNEPEVAARTYQLLITVSAPVRVTVGRLGTFDFPAGDYCYTGSAVRNIEARIRRHLSPLKKMHWHIDYLLAAPESWCVRCCATQARNAQLTGSLSARS